VAAPPTPTPPTTYIVRSGDSAWTIAARYRISLDDFLWFNSMAEDDLLEPGDVVTIRLAEGQPLPPTPTPQLTHVVSSGETLWDISMLYGLTVDDLLSLNGFTANTVLSIGQEVYIRATPMPTPTPTSHPPTFTPIAPGESAGDEALQLAASLPAATPTPPSPLADARLASAANSQPVQPSGVSNQFESNWMSNWMLGVAIAFIALAFFLLFVVMILLMRRLTEPRE
jgi:LysM repeat protein